MFNDEGNPAAINEPVKDYPVTHFLKLADNDEINYNPDVLSCLANLSNDPCYSTQFGERYVGYATSSCSKQGSLS